MTVVEVDGNSHDNKVDYDTQRDAFLTDLGLQVIHIPVADVKQNLLAVMDMLMQKLFPAPEALDGDARPVEDKTTTTSQGM